MLNQMGHMGIIQLLGQITPRICQFTRCLDLKWLQNRIFEKKSIRSCPNRESKCSESIFEFGNNWCAPSCNTSWIFIIHILTPCTENRLNTPTMVVYTKHFRDIQSGPSIDWLLYFIKYLVVHQVVHQVSWWWSS